MIKDEDLEKMVEEWTPSCLINRDEEGNLTRVSNEWFGLLWVKENGKWKIIELMKGAEEDARKNQSKVWCPL